MDAKPISRIKRLDAALERPITWLFLIGAVAWGLGSTVTRLIQLISNLISDRIPLSLFAEAPLPVPSDASGGTAQLVHGSFESAFVTVSDLSPMAVFLIALGSATGILTNLIVSMAVAHLCWKLLRRRPFDRSVSWMVMAVGTILMLGTVIGGGLGGLGHMMAAVELNSDIQSGFWALGFSLDITPLVVGLVLFLVTMAFEAGTRMQRDTEGLV